MNAIGVMLNNVERDRLRAFAAARALGFTLVHANALPEAMLQGEPRQAYLDAARASGLTIATLYVGFDGQDYSSPRTIAETVGLVRSAFRDRRFAIARLYSALATELGVPSLSLHLGFLPDTPAHPDYAAVVRELQRLADDCAAVGQALHLETGQESADRLLQLIDRVGRPNLGVNFDPANFLLYGTDEPLSALDKLWPLVRGVHCKDGFPPTQPDTLGREVPLGEGAVNVPAFVQRLRALGYAGPLVIEREGGGRVIDDILAARTLLERLLQSPLAGSHSHPAR